MEEPNHCMKEHPLDRLSVCNSLAHQCIDEWALIHRTRKASLTEHLRRCQQMLTSAYEGDIESSCVLSLLSFVLRGSLLPFCPSCSLPLFSPSLSLLPFSLHSLLFPAATDSESFGARVAEKVQLKTTAEEQRSADCADEIQPEERTQSKLFAERRA